MFDDMAAAPRASGGTLATNSESTSLAAEPNTVSAGNGDSKQWSSLLEQHNVRLVGSGSQVVVMGHGFGTDQTVWQHCVPYVAEGYRVLLFDLMGAGSTDPDLFSFTRYATLHAYADDLLAILEEVGVEECVYVGHSVSGMIGCIAAIERPEIFKKIILLDASPRYLNDLDYEGGFEQSTLNDLFLAMQANFQSWASGFAPLVVGSDIDCLAVQEFSRTLFSMRPDIALSVSKTIFQSDMRAILPMVKVPCHILQSTKDLAVPVSVSQYLRQNLGGKTVVEIFPVHGHLPQLSSPDIVVPALLRHIYTDI